MKLPYMLQTRLEAEWWLSYISRDIDDMLDRYGFVSVIDVHNSISNWLGCVVSPSLRYIDNCYGWYKGEFSIEIWRVHGWGYDTYCYEVPEPRLWHTDS